MLDLVLLVSLFKFLLLETFVTKDSTLPCLEDCYKTINNRTDTNLTYLSSTSLQIDNWGDQSCSRGPGGGDIKGSRLYISRVS